MTISRIKKHRGLDFSWKIVGKLFLSITVVLVLFLGFITLKHIEYFPIKVVKIFGVQHVNHDEVQSLVTPLINKGFFSVNADLIKDQLMQLPWIANVAVRRIWPDQVQVIINERQAVARWNSINLLSTTGELFKPAIETYPKELPLFIGPEGKQIIMAKYYAKMSSILVPLHFKIIELEWSSAEEWTLTLNNGMKLKIGHKDILTRISHFVKVYPQIMRDHTQGVESIDLRYPNGIAVRWNQSHNL